MYAAFTPDGIEFSIWTRSGRYSIFDTVTSFDPDEMHLYEFSWDWSAKLLGGGAKAAIFVDRICTASSNMPISDDDLTNVEFTFLDTEWMDFQTDCTLADVMTYDTVPAHLRDSVHNLTSYHSGTGYVALAMRSKTVLFAEPWSDSYILRDGGPLLDLRFSMAACDTSGDLYTASNRGVAGYGTVSLISQYGSPVTAWLSMPTVVAVTQIDGVAFPKIYSDNVRRCPYVWVADGADVILFDHYLQELTRRTGFSEVSCIVPTSDGRAWILDKGGDKLYLLAEGSLDILDELASTSPDCGAITASGKLYVYDSDNMTIRLYERGAEIGSYVLTSGPIRIDVDPVTDDVFAFHADGVVQRIDGDLAGPPVEWFVSPALTYGAVRRGVGREALVLVDAATKMMYETDYGGVVTRSAQLPAGQYTGAGVVLAENNGDFISTTTIPTEVSADTAVADLEVYQFNVDRMVVDLSGGRENGMETSILPPNAPTDLPFGIHKGTRLPE